MRKKLDTRFPAARIKKIMQADEDVGKIALAVPVLVSKALELFLQDLCDRTYDITLQRGAKTVSSLHLKHCVQSYNVFDFLREIVSKVPDYGHSDAGAEDKTVSRRRKAAGDELNDSDEESKRSRTVVSPASGSGRGRGRGKGRGRGRGARALERESSHLDFDSDPSPSTPHGNKQILVPGMLVDGSTSEPKEMIEENVKVRDSAGPAVQSFDLNSELDENANTTTIMAPPAPALASAPASESAPAGAASERPAEEVKGEEYPGWSMSEMDRMAIDPLQLAHLNSRVDEEEDYDEE